MSSWKRSSQCGSGACLEACRLGSMIVLVRDSKDPGVYQEWSIREWNELLDDVKTGLARPNGVVVYVDGTVDVGLERHDDRMLAFTADEWKAFTKDVEDGKFEIDKLLEFTQLSSPATAAGGSAEAGSSDSVAADSDQMAAAGASLPAAPAAAQTLVPVTAGHAFFCYCVQCRELRAASTPPAVAGLSFESRFRALFESGDILGAQKAILAHLNDEVDPLLNSPAGRPVDASTSEVGPMASAGQPGLTNLQRVHKVVLSQIRLGGSKTEIADGIVADLQEGGLIVDDGLYAARIWVLAEEPGPEVTAVRDADGETWLRRAGRPSLAAPGETWTYWSPEDVHDHRATWSQLLVEWGPLTDATPAHLVPAVETQETVS